MLNKTKTLKGYTLHSRDGEIGTVKEFYFDDHHWTIRYLIAETRNWLTGKQVLISPYALGAVNKEEHYIAINLTKKQIEDSPALDSDKPVSRQFEEAYYGYYGWPMYWGGSNMWGMYSYPYSGRESTQGKNTWDHHLRSTHDMSGHAVQAEDGEIGHIDDFIIDDETWAIRYLIIDTRNLWPGKKVLISPRWIEHVSWRESKVFVNLSREAIKQSTEYTEESLLTRDYETGLHRHYNRQGYWVDEAAARADVEIKRLVISHGITADYLGQIEGETPNGWGKACYLDGKIYDGEWKDGKMHGRGKEFYPDGTLEFEGQYKDGCRDGFGKSYLREGKLIYEGEWKNGAQAGDQSDQTNWA